MSKICGIYMIQNTINGKIYIGQSIDCETRWKQHQHSFTLNLEYRSLLYSNIKKYGIQNFKFSILINCKNKLELNYYEKLYIKLYHSNDYDFGYNLTSGGDGGDTCSGRHPGEEELKRRIESIRKFWDSEEGYKMKLKISKEHKGLGYKHTEEWINNMKSIWDENKKINSI